MHLSEATPYQIIMVRMEHGECSEKEANTKAVSNIASLSRLFELQSRETVQVNRKDEEAGTAQPVWISNCLMKANDHVLKWKAHKLSAMVSKRVYVTRFEKKDWPEASVDQREKLRSFADDPHIIESKVYVNNESIEIVAVFFTKEGLDDTRSDRS